MQKKYLVTPALPYANGAVHLGHLVEHIQVNIFVRALRMAGHRVLNVCGADSHGTPIEMNALKAGVSPADFAAQFQKLQGESLAAYGIEFDGGYGSTHTKANEHYATKVFNAFKEHGAIKTREIEQLYDPELKRFLPDRMVRGVCPKCNAKDQYGDGCEVCGRTYSPTELVEPKSALSGATPVLKKSVHYFVSLAHFEKPLREWLDRPHTLHSDTRAYLEHWFREGLKDWDISRDGPYFGFKIPGEDDKYFYVWLDAPIGYISLTEKAAAEFGHTVADYWLDKDTEIIHFIGKDIVYFHTLFWPAMLVAAGYTLPRQIVVHGMLTVNGEKMSKSRGTFILADTFSKHLSTEALRYYYACKLSKRAEDIDLNLGDFVQRVNTDLVNKVVNLVSRALPLLHRLFDGKAGKLDDAAADLIAKVTDTVGKVEAAYLDNEPGQALSDIVRLAEDANRYLQDGAPWQLVKTDAEKAHQILTTGLYIGRVCFGLLKPVMPNAVKELEDMLNDGQPYSFATVGAPFKGQQTLKPYHHLFTRIEDENVKAMIEDSKPKTDEAIAPTTAPSMPHIDINQFMAVELRAAIVVDAVAVKDSDKLIACTLDVGPLGHRNVFSGLRPHVTPEHMIGKTVALVVNLAPRKMRFGISEGMILACGEDVPVLITLEGVKPGERIR